MILRDTYALLDVVLVLLGLLLVERLDVLRRLIGVLVVCRLLLVIMRWRHAHAPNRAWRLLLSRSILLSGELVWNH